jgi:uncharacterized membrane protein YfcA
MAVLAGFCCGVARAGLAGVGMMTVLLMADIFPGKLSSGVVLQPLIFADAMAEVPYRQEIHWPRIRALFWPILVGIIAGWGVLCYLPNAAFKPLIGGMILVMPAIQIFRNQAARPTVLPNGAAGVRVTRTIKVKAISRESSVSARKPSGIRPSGWNGIGSGSNSGFNVLPTFGNFVVFSASISVFSTGPARVCLS